MRSNWNNILLTLTLALQGSAFPAFAADERVSGFTSEDILAIQAREAELEEQSDIIHFAGGFELRANDWYLSSDQATLYGKLDDPETVIVTGSPALIGVTTVVQGRASMVNGSARRIVYERDSKTIRMEGNATLSRDGHTLDGGEIEYHIDDDQLRAGGRGGVHIRVDPDNSD
jgi:lipopolysaccharide transport protein LptA